MWLAQTVENIDAVSGDEALCLLSDGLSLFLQRANCVMHKLIKLALAKLVL